MIRVSRISPLAASSSLAMSSSSILRSLSGPRKRMELVRASAWMETLDSSPRGTGGSMAWSLAATDSARALASGIRRTVVCLAASGVSKVLMRTSAILILSGGPWTTMLLIASRAATRTPPAAAGDVGRRKRERKRLGAAAWAASASIVSSTPTISVARANWSLKVLISLARTAVSTFRMNWSISANCLGVPATKSWLVAVSASKRGSGSPDADAPGGRVRPVRPVGPCAP